MPAVIVQGDSLAVGMRPALTRNLPVASYDAATGRGTIEGVFRLRAQHIRGKIVLVSLGTNDLGRSETWMAEEVRNVLRLRPRCVVWGEIRVLGRRSSLTRPLNAALRRFGDVRRVRAVTPRAGDGVHLTAAGYRLRAKRFARAARSC